MQMHHDLFDRALSEEIGIAVEAPGRRETFRNELYEARRTHPRGDELVLFAPAPPYDHEVWICRKSVELP